MCRNSKFSPLLRCQKKAIFCRLCLCPSLSFGECKYACTRPNFKYPALNCLNTGQLSWRHDFNPRSWNTLALLPLHSSSSSSSWRLRSRRRHQLRRTAGEVHIKYLEKITLINTFGVFFSRNLAPLFPFWLDCDQCFGSHGEEYCCGILTHCCQGWTTKKNRQFSVF